MRAVVYLPLLASVAFVCLSRPACRRLPPCRAAWSITAAMAVLAASTVGALGLLAWPLMARVPIVAAAGRWRPGAVTHGVPVPVVASLVAWLALVALAHRAVDQLGRLRRELVETARLHAELGSTGRGRLAVLDDPVPEAHALPPTLSLPGRVVISTGLLAALDDDERAAVLAHEHAHLTHAHRLFTAISALAAALNPVLSPARANVAFALERWADEDAAARTSRAVAARALAKAALAKLSTPRPTVASALIMGLGQLGVPERVTALLDRDDRSHDALAWLLVGLALGGILAVAWATHDTERLFETLRTR